MTERVCVRAHYSISVLHQMATMARVSNPNPGARILFRISHRSSGAQGMEPASAISQALSTELDAKWGSQGLVSTHMKWWYCRLRLSLPCASIVHLPKIIYLSYSLGINTQTSDNSTSKMQRIALSVICRKKSDKQVGNESSSCSSLFLLKSTYISQTH